MERKPPPEGIASPIVRTTVLPRFAPPPLADLDPTRIKTRLDPGRPARYDSRFTESQAIVKQAHDRNEPPCRLIDRADSAGASVEQEAPLCLDGT